MRPNSHRPGLPKPSALPEAAQPEPPLWDVFCRVVDNYGDLGMCRRLALHLAAQGQSVRLWVDDAALMQRMASEIPPADETPARTHAAGVRWIHWQAEHDSWCGHEPADVVIEALGCQLPQAYLHRMRLRAEAGTCRPAVWINLEYLSAQAYVEHSHGLPSPQASGPGRGLAKWFYFPGFTPQTGGLLREDLLLQRRLAFDTLAWLQVLGIPSPAAPERRVSIFAYPQAPLERLMDSLARSAHADGCPVRLMLTQGPLQERASRWLQDHAWAQSTLRTTELPWLSTEDFDHLLWACDLNMVRGEDSLVRALWAGRPFIWQLYPQHDGAHAGKLQAFWDAVPGADGPTLHASVMPWWWAWNGLGPWPGGAAFPWSAEDAWSQAAQQSCARLMRQVPLAQALMHFVAERGGPG